MIFMLVSGTGHLYTSATSSVLVNPDGVTAGMLASALPASCAWLLVTFKRDDLGFRHKGLPSVVTLGALLAALIQAASMLFWPLVVDSATHGDTVIGMYGSDLLASGLAVAFVTAMFAWSSVTALGCAWKRLPSVLVGVFVMVALVGIGAWRGIRVFDSPPTNENLIAWAAIGGLGLVLLPVLAAVVTMGRHDAATSL